MNPTVRVLLAVLVAFVGSVSGLAQSHVRAMIRVDRTNLRAKPSKDAEILASLTKGEIVEVLGEEIPAGQKEAWSRVVLPASVPVWIYGSGVDKSGRIKNPTLNFRTGPGRNYSVLGTLRRGDSVVIQRESDGWRQITPPSGAVAYVASRLLTTPTPPSSPAPVAKSTPPTPAVTREVTTPPTPAVRPPAPSTPATIPAPSQVPPVTKTEPAPSPTATATVPPTEPAAEPPPISTVVFTPIATASPAPAIDPVEPSPLEPESPVTAEPTVVDPAPAAEAPAPKPRPPLGSPRARLDAGLPASPVFPVLAADPDPTRPKPGDSLPEPRRVTREGVVHRTDSIQAPSDFELRDGFYNEGRLDYLYLEPQEDLKKFLGKRVHAEGEEYLDSRWRTPMLRVDTIRLTE